MKYFSEEEVKRILYDIDYNWKSLPQCLYDYEYIEVDEGPYKWRTGTPTENGWYVVATEEDKQGFNREEMIKWRDGSWDFSFLLWIKPKEIVKWRKVDVKE